MMNPIRSKKSEISADSHKANLTSNGMKKGLSIVVIIVIIGGLLGATIYYLVKDNPEPNPINTYTTPADTSMVRAVSPGANASVRSPLVITGEARGNWYFEASFPVKILDANGNVLGQHYAEAQDEWMTTEFVPFKSTLNFSTPTTPTGTLVLEKDNPSGLPENDAEVRVPIRFDQTSAAQTRTVKLYFYNENKDKDVSGNVMCSPQGLVVLERTIPLTNTPIQDALKELLKGPTATERVQAPSTEFPLAGLTLTGANLSNNVLTLSFNDPQNKTSGGSCRVQVLRSQIEATAKQFGAVTTVRYQPSQLFQP